MQQLTLRVFQGTVATFYNIYRGVVDEVIVAYVNFLRILGTKNY